jgi:hypothetical protein
MHDGGLPSERRLRAASREEAMADFKTAWEAAN